MVRILTCCKHGLVRSVALADVLKLHFEPVDVIPVGLDSNNEETLYMLYMWADFTILMEEKFRKRLLEVTHGNQHRVLVCEVGNDVYGNSHHPSLIDKCWRWCRQEAMKMGIQEHQRKI